MLNRICLFGRSSAWAWMVLLAAAALVGGVTLSGCNGGADKSAGNKANAKGKGSPTDSKAGNDSGSEGSEGSQGGATPGSRSMAGAPDFFGVNHSGQRPDSAAPQPEPAAAPSFFDRDGSNPPTAAAKPKNADSGDGALAVAVDPAKIKMADELFIAAESAKSDADLLDALKKTLEANPGHLKANLRLADLLIRQKKIDASIDQVAKIAPLVGDDKSAEAKLAELKLALAVLRVHASQWAAIRKQFAAKYESIAEAAEVAAKGLPSAAAALTRAAILLPDDKSLAHRRDAAEAAVPTQPDVADEPDPKAAKILRDQAEELTRGGRHDEAAKLLLGAYAFLPDDPATVCDLASCQAKSGHPGWQPLAAILLSAARHTLCDQGSPKTTEGKALVARIDQLLGLADPKMAAVEQLDQQLVAAAKPVRQSAQADPDNHLVEDIAKCLAAIEGLDPAGEAVAGAAGAAGGGASSGDASATKIGSNNKPDVKPAPDTASPTVSDPSPRPGNPRIRLPRRPRR